MGRRLALHLLRLRAACAGVDLPEYDNKTLHDITRQNRARGMELVQVDHKRANLRANHRHPGILSVAGKGHAFGMAEGLLPLSETTSAADWTCPYFRVRPDMSSVN